MTAAETDRFLQVAVGVDVVLAVGMSVVEGVAEVVAMERAVMNKAVQRALGRRIAGGGYVEEEAGCRGLIEVKADAAVVGEGRKKIKRWETNRQPSFVSEEGAAAVECPRRPK